MVSEAPAPDTDPTTLAKVATVVHFLCIHDHVPVPAWTRGHRADPEVMLFDISLDRPYGQMMQQTAPAVCAAYGIYFTWDLLDLRRQSMIGSEQRRCSRSYSRGTPHTGSSQGPTSATIMEKNRHAPSRGCHRRCRYWRKGRSRGDSRWRAQICPNRARRGASPIQGGSKFGASRKGASGREGIDQDRRMSPRVLSDSMRTSATNRSTPG